MLDTIQLCIDYLLMFMTTKISDLTYLTFLGTLLKFNNKNEPYLYTLEQQRDLDVHK